MKSVAAEICRRIEEFDPQATVGGFDSAMDHCDSANIDLTGNAARHRSCSCWPRAHHFKLQQLVSCLLSAFQMSSGRPTKSKVNPLVQTNTVWAFAELEEYNNALMQSVAAHSCQTHRMLQSAGYGGWASCRSRTLLANSFLTQAEVISPCQSMQTAVYMGCLHQFCVITPSISLTGKHCSCYTSKLYLGDHLFDKLQPDCSLM